MRIRTPPVELTLDTFVSDAAFRPSKRDEAELDEEMRTFIDLAAADNVRGLTFGIVLAAIASRLLTALLYGFRPDYTPVAAVVSVVLVAVAALACFVPALRASRIDPMMA